MFYFTNQNHSSITKTLELLLHKHSYFSTFSDRFTTLYHLLLYTHTNLLFAKRRKKLLNFHASWHLATSFTQTSFIFCLEDENSSDQNECKVKVVQYELGRPKMDRVKNELFERLFSYQNHTVYFVCKNSC